MTDFPDSILLPPAGAGRTAALRRLLPQEAVRALLLQEPPRASAPAPRPRKPRRPSISKMIEQAEKAGTPLASVTLPDGTKLDFGKPESVEADNSWPLDEFRTKETKQ